MRMAYRPGALALMLMLALLPVAGSAATGVATQNEESFYDAKINLHDAQPGEIIRIEEVAPKSADARVWRMIYVSTTSDDSPVAVSALLAVPAAPAPAEGYPLGSVGHGSVGVGQECAPSIDPWGSALGSPSSYDLFVEPLVSAGYAVVMTDYQGLGVEGSSSYLIGELEGRNILDAARAAFAFPDLDLQPDLMIWGQSQGGHAALFAGQLAPTYAPELDVVGVVAEAPATDLATMYAELIEADARGGIISLPLMTIGAWVEEYPEIVLDAVLTEQGQEVLERVVKPSCLTGAFFLTQILRPSALIQPGALELLDVFIEANTPAPGPYAMPVMVVQGEADETVPMEFTQQFVEQMCDVDTNVTYQTYPDIGHIEVIDAALPDVLGWMQDVRAGVTPISTCES